MRRLLFVFVALVLATAAFGVAQPAFAQSTIKYGDTVNGEIIANDPNGPYVLFMFDGSQGDVITATMTRTSGDLNPLISLGYFQTANNAVRLAGSGPAVNGTTATLSFTLPDTRQYYVLATRDGIANGKTAGKFTLTLAGKSSSPCGGVQDPTNVTVPPDANKQQFKQADQVIDPTHTYCAIVTTNHGRIVIQLYPKSAPKNVNSFVFLAEKGFYDNLTWHRVISGFMAQTGDPTATGSGGPGYSTPLEIDPNLKYDRAGRLGVARSSDPNSAGSQFFITFTPQPGLDPAPGNDGYTIIGQVVEGQSVVDQIAVRDPDNPTGPGDPLVSVRIVDVTANPVGGAATPAATAATAATPAATAAATAAQ